MYESTSRLIRRGITGACCIRCTHGFAANQMQNALVILRFCLLENFHWAYHASFSDNRSCVWPHCNDARFTLGGALHDCVYSLGGHLMALRRFRCGWRTANRSTGAGNAKAVSNFVQSVRALMAAFFMHVKQIIFVAEHVMSARDHRVLRL